MRRRINITLPEQTVQVIDHMAGKGERSRLIDEAVRHYVITRGREKLRMRLKEGAIRRAERDLAMADEGVALEEEAWRRGRR